MATVFFGGLFKDIEFLNGRHERLFGEDIEAVFKQVLCDFKVLVAGSGIHDKVDILAVENIVIVFKYLAAVLLSSTVAAGLQRLDNADNLESLGVLFQVQSVNIASASALTEYYKT